ncbi:hypothetical protein ETAA8_07850 [Anatilimnocola aggregata]|uniref:Uncharacterized protein n=1 Tax=Anatilimnocola aggregata TaxID=2528021 RepID=A0A517Y659_9BACT|nr:hypothetical protein [Anatilimnocola aggregata]QDU25715.1 hypothetical protein ETAA8_07850 [Anatilimnocola aggregata]
MSDFRPGCPLRLLGAFLFVLGSWVAAQPSMCVAASGGVNVLPIPGRLNTSGVKLVVDTRWVDGHGYRPVRLELIPNKVPAAGYRKFRVVLRPNSYYGNPGDTISQMIELEQGSSKATATMPVPQDAMWHSVVVEVFEEGRRHADLSGDHLSWPRGGGGWNWNEGTPGVLLIDAKAPTLAEREALLQVFQSSGTGGLKGKYDHHLPDVRNLLRQFSDTQFQGNFVSDEDSRNAHSVLMLNELKDNAKAEVLPPSELPTKWINYSSLDLILISLADLKDMAKSHPAVMRALADWNRAGRFLIVFNTGEDFAGLEQLEKLLQLAPLPNPDENDTRGWQKPSPYRPGEVLRGLVDNNNGNLRQPSRVVINSGEETAALTKLGFISRDAGLGQVIAIAGDPFPGSEVEWIWILNSIRGEGWNPSIRTGTSFQQRNEDFWNFLIPGTGQAPVLSFLVFITLFVVLIGPVNYYLLNRARRLYLLLITVPAGALLVTASLFLYAMLTDGLGVKSRVRSYTTIEQRAGNVASTSRQAYYASIAPSQGFQFQDDTFISQYEHEPVAFNGQRQNRRIVNWAAHDQQLKSGYIASRTLSQVMVTSAGKTKARLRVGKAEGETLRVKNELSMPLSYLVVCAEQDKYYVGEKVPQGEATLKLVPLTEVSRVLAQRLRRFEPSFPEGYDANMHDSPLDIWSFGPRYYGRYGNTATVHQGASLLERNLAQFSHLASQPLAPRSYVALSETSPEVPLGVPRTQQQLSLHVTEGHY